MKILIKSPPLPEQTSPAWMLTFADLLSLVLTFFVLIIATAKPIVQGSVYNKSSETIIAASTAENENQIKLHVTDQQDSVTYLYKIIHEKLLADKDLANIKLVESNETLVISSSTEKFSQISLKLARLLKVVDNDIWIYSSDINISHRALGLLKNNGLNKNIIIAQSATPQGQIDIVIFP